MISFIIPTLGRHTLERTLRSVKPWTTDEVLLVGDETLREHVWQIIEKLNLRNARFIPCAPGHDWGSTERNAAMPQAHGRYLAFLDDDDIYVPDHRELMADAIERTQDDVPIIFRMRFPNGITLWYENERVIRCGNVGTPMFLIPNVPERLGQWGPLVGGDCIFLETCTWPRESVVWRPEIIALIGHNT